MSQYLRYRITCSFVSGKLVDYWELRWAVQIVTQYPYLFMPKGEGSLVYFLGCWGQWLRRAAGTGGSPSRSFAAVAHGSNSEWSQTSSIGIACWFPGLTQSQEGWGCVLTNVFGDLHALKFGNHCLGSVCCSPKITSPQRWLGVPFVTQRRKLGTLWVVISYGSTPWTSKIRTEILSFTNSEPLSLTRGSHTELFPQWAMYTVPSPSRRCLL